MKCLILFGLVSYVLGSGYHFPVTGPLVTGIVNTGRSTQYRNQDNLGNYAFGYDEEHATGGTFRREAGNAFGQVIGSYGLRDIDGRIRIVNYVADDGGFRADIKTNEPGVEPKDSAATRVNKPDVAIVAAPAVPLVASAPITAQYTAPVATQVAAPIATYASPVQRIVAPAPAPVAYKATPIYTQAPVAVKAAPAYAPSSVAVKAAPAYAPAPVAVQDAPVIASPQANVINPGYLAPTTPAVYTPKAIVSNQVVFGPPAVPKYTSRPAYLSAPVSSVFQSPTTYLELANTYVHPASWGYSLGIPSTWGYTYILRKKK